MNKLTTEEMVFLLNSVMDVNSRNKTSLEKFPENKTLEVKVNLGQKVQAKIALAYADMMKEFAQ